MSSSTPKVFLCLSWLSLMLIFCIHTPSCEAVQKYCGGALPDVLDMICTNGFAAKKVKKSIDPLDYYGGVEEDLSSSIEQFPFLSKNTPNALAKIRRRRHFGVYDECCRKPCTMSELRTYCI